MTGKKDKEEDYQRIPWDLANPSLGETKHLPKIRLKWAWKCARCETQLKGWYYYLKKDGGKYCLDCGAIIEHSHIIDTRWELDAAGRESVRGRFNCRP